MEIRPLGDPADHRRTRTGSKPGCPPDQPTARPTDVPSAFKVLCWVNFTVGPAARLETRPY